MHRRACRARQRLFALKALHDVVTRVDLGPVLEDVLLSVRSAMRGRPLEEREASGGSSDGVLAAWQPFTSLTASDSLSFRHHYLVVRGPCLAGVARPSGGASAFARLFTLVWLGCCCG
jgi:hypothetical protein